MFDAKPNPPGTRPIAPANKPSIPNIGDIKNVRYLEQIFDPDIHPIKDMDKYIVPLEGEIVIDVVGKRFLEVKHVDRYATWKSTYANWFPLPEKTDNDYDLFPQHEYGFLQGQMALMIDFSVRPPVARVDSNATAPNAAYGILYLGSIISEKGQIISASYSGQSFVKNEIDVSPVVFDNLENKVVMGANSFSVTKNEAELPNSTICTLVYYDQGGVPIPPTYPLVVQHSGYLRDHKLDQKYVKSIELISPWFTNSTKPNTLFIPVNLALKTVEFRAQVHYSDGTTEEYPVNSFNGDSGFSLHGLDKFKPTTPGQIGDALVLTYTFKEHEQALMAQPGGQRKLSEVYEIVATPSKGAYSPRIYSYPYWDVNSAYKLKHFLTDLDRKYCRDVTDLVTLNDTSPVFQGSNFGVEQPMVFNLNMRDVSAIYEPWAFVQHTTITLYNQPTAPGRKWDVRHSYSKPAFNNMLIEYKESVNGTIDAKFANLTDQADFIAKGYHAFEPIYDPRTEVKAPEPTHFDLVRTTGVAKTAIPVANYNKLPISDLGLADGETLFIRWVRRDQTGNELQLGVSATVCRKISN